MAQLDITRFSFQLVNFIFYGLLFYTIQNNLILRNSLSGLKLFYKLNNINFYNKILKGKFLTMMIMRSILFLKITFIAIKYIILSSISIKSIKKYAN